MSSFRVLRARAAGIAVAALMLSPVAVTAAPAAISARVTNFGDGNFSITVSWNSGSDNGNPVLWVCESCNGNAPISFDMGASGSQIANFIPKGTYVFGLYTSMECATLVDNQTVTVAHR
jgi:hypothetical protein